MESIKLKDKKFWPLLTPCWLHPGVSSMNTIGNNKKSTKLKQGLQAVPMGKRQPSSPKGLEPSFPSLGLDLPAETQASKSDSVQRPVIAPKCAFAK